MDSREYKMLRIVDFSSVDESLLQYLGGGYDCSKHNDHVVYFKLENNSLSIPEVTSAFESTRRCMSSFFTKERPSHYQHGSEKEEVVR